MAASAAITVTAAITITVTMVTVATVILDPKKEGDGGGATIPDPAVAV